MGFLSGGKRHSEVSRAFVLSPGFGCHWGFEARLQWGALNQWPKRIAMRKPRGKEVIARRHVGVKPHPGRPLRQDPGVGEKVEEVSQVPPSSASCSVRCHLSYSAVAHWQRMAQGPQGCPLSHPFPHLHTCQPGSDSKNLIPNS